MRTPVARSGRDNWEEVIAHRPDVLLEGFESFKDYLVLSERKDGLVQLRVRPWSGGGRTEYYLDFGEPAYLAYVSVNREFDTPLLRFVYTSLTTPSSTYDYDMRTRQKTLLKRDSILGGFDPANYVTERLYTTARDGARVPISVVYLHNRHLSPKVRAFVDWVAELFGTCPLLSGRSDGDLECKFAGKPGANTARAVIDQKNSAERLY